MRKNVFTRRGTFIQLQSSCVFASLKCINPNPLHAQLYLCIQRGLLFSPTEDFLDMSARPSPAGSAECQRFFMAYWSPPLFSFLSFSPPALLL
jgi:hypothetical protein